MKIREIRAAGLRGASPEGGWDNDLRPEDNIYTLVAVHTDEGLVGLGSVYTEPWRLDADGMLAIPAAPGLGIRLDPDNLARYTNGERLLAP